MTSLFLKVAGPLSGRTVSIAGGELPVRSSAAGSGANSYAVFARHNEMEIQMLNRSKTAAGTAARRGFTLLELVIVLLILGILAAIAIPTFNLIQQNAVERAVTTSAGAIVRNANAIAASAEASGGVVTSVELWDAAGESYSFDASTVTSPYTSTSATQKVTAGTAASGGGGTGPSLVLKEVSGNITRCVTVWSNNGKAEVMLDSVTGVTVVTNSC